MPVEECFRRDVSPSLGVSEASKAVSLSDASGQATLNGSVQIGSRGCWQGRVWAHPGSSASMGSLRSGGS